MGFSQEPRFPSKSRKAESTSAESIASASTDPTTIESEEASPLLYRDPHETKGHARALDLSKFATLPYDIRALIWETTFSSRQISLVCETVRVTSILNHPFKRITVSSTLSEYGGPVEYTSFLTCPKIDTPAALSANRESRRIALVKYRPWKMFNKELHYRNIMWNPSIDVVDLLQAVKVPIDEHVPFVKPLPLFERQFPAEVGEIKALAVPSTLWGEGEHKNIDVVWPLIDFSNLRELVVVVDKLKEREHAYNHKRGLSSMAMLLVEAGVDVNWTIPEDITDHIDNVRVHYEMFGPKGMKLPKKVVVTVVDKDEEIHGNQDLRLIVRCQPCPYLGITSKA